MGRQSIILELPARIKPYVRMTQRSKWTDPQAQEYLAEREALQISIKAQMAANGWEMLPASTPLCIKIWLGACLHNRDIDNEEKAILDAMELFIGEMEVLRVEKDIFDYSYEKEEQGGVGFFLPTEEE